MLCPMDNGGFRLQRNGVWRCWTVENRQHDRRWRSRASRREHARCLV